MSLCATCGRRIIWCRTELGKKMPVDPDPAPDGNLILTGSQLLPTAKTVGKAGNTDNKPLYKSHFATCRDAAKHRRDRQKKQRDTKPGQQQPSLFGK